LLEEEFAFRIEQENTECPVKDAGALMRVNFGNRPDDIVSFINPYEGLCHEGCLLFIMSGEDFYLTIIEVNAWNVLNPIT
jgi:hypothetical protein